MLEWLSLIIPSSVSIIGFFVTYFSLSRQFKNSIKEQITEDRRKVYLDTFADVDKAVTNSKVIYNPKYYDSLVQHKPEIKLAGSKEVIIAYKDYMRFVFNIAYPAWKWISENHPDANKNNYEYKCDEDGNEVEISHITEDMLNDFEDDYEKYQQDHMPKREDVQKKVLTLLNAMRADIGNKKVDL